MSFGMRRSLRFKASFRASFKSPRGQGEPARVSGVSASVARPPGASETLEVGPRPRRPRWPQFHVYRVRRKFYPEATFSSPPANAFRRAALRVYRVRQKVQPGWQFAPTQGQNARGRPRWTKAAAPLLQVSQVISFGGRVEEPRDLPQRRARPRLRPLWSGVFRAAPPRAPLSPRPRWRRAPVFLRRLRQNFRRTL
jgi:hypothetical protein